MILNWVWLLLEVKQVLRLWQLQQLLELLTAQSICKHSLAMSAHVYQGSSWYACGSSITS